MYLIIHEYMNVYRCIETNATFVGWYTYIHSVYMYTSLPRSKPSSANSCCSSGLGARPLRRRISLIDPTKHPGRNLDSFSALDTAQRAQNCPCCAHARNST